MLAHDEQRSWLLLADAGRPVGDFGNPPETWLTMLPRYAELQRGEVAYVADHVPMSKLPALACCRLVRSRAQCLTKSLAPVVPRSNLFHEPL